MVKYAILGPIELCDGVRRLAIDAPRQLALLGYLLLHANRPVSVDELNDALWGDHEPQGALKRVQVTVARLRKTLDAATSDRGSTLRTVPGGYLLEVGRGDVDADVFASLAEDGRAALDAGTDAVAADVLREALGLWRGPALAQLTYEDFAQLEIRRLEELRLAVLQARVDADLRLGRHASLIAELEALVSRHPTRERLVAQLMLALYRSGRQAEALDAYQRTRQHLATELGLDPSAELQALRAQMLEQSASLDARNDPDAAAATADAAPDGEPWHAPARSGREEHEAPAEAAAAPRAPPSFAQDSLRLVSILAARADVSDAEGLHRIYERCAAVIERHGGTIERYLGDVLIGLFGLTQSAGDEALRAARTAVELGAATPQLCIGLESGEVFLRTGSRGETMTTGAAIASAGRLAERAAAGEILLGDRIRPAIAAAARIDAARGRLVELRVEQPALLRTPPTPFIGRTHELAALTTAFANARDNGVCQLVSIVGAPGIGKSRLAGQFLGSLGRSATVLAGRCLAYGEGTTYHAVADLVNGLGDDPRRTVEDLLAGNDQAIRAILAAIGVTQEPTQPEEIAWALRRLLQRLARDRPLVVAIEDIHWAEPALLDLIDHVVALSGGCPILMVCLTRPELLEARPEWATPRPGATVLLLDALGPDDARELAERLGASEMADRIVQRAEGNPLFVEQLVEVGADSGELPSSIRAVLAARIDRLDGAERMLLQRAAVEGRTFHSGALATLLPAHERDAMELLLTSLARKGLIAGDRPQFPGEDAFRFSHALIRDVAYAGLPRLVRADLHADVADWLEERSRAPDEVVGFHLEQACVLARELGRDGERERAARAVTRLEAAAGSALRRDDPYAASELLQRATELVASEPAARDVLLPALGAALFAAGRMTEATRVLDEAIAAVRAPGLQARAQVEREFVRLETDTSAGTEQSQRVADAVLPLLDDEDDDDGRSRLWSLRAYIDWTRGQVGAADAAWSKAAEFAARAGDERELFEVIGWRASAAVLGPTPVGEAIRRCEGFRDQVSASPVAVGWTVRTLAVLHAMRGEVELADELIAQADETLRELGSLNSSVSHQEAEVLMVSGRPALAEARLRTTVERLAAMSVGGFMATTTAMLAQVVYDQGRLVEAGELCATASLSAADDDTLTQVIWRGVQAKILARDGRRDAARALAREAVALVEPTDLLSHHGDALLDLAEVLRMCTRPDEACDAVRAALALYERKGNIVAAARAQSLLNQSGGA